MRLPALGFGGAVDDSDSDHLLWHMVVLAEHDLLAARIVLHRVMPALLAVAKRRGAIIAGGIVPEILLEKKVITLDHGPERIVDFDGVVELTEGNDSRCGTHVAKSRQGTPLSSSCR